jgi:hypothetical protein
MLKMRTTRTVELFGLALVLLAVVATAAYFKLVGPAPQPPMPAEQAVGQAVAPVAVAAHPVAARSLYMSEQTLRRMLDDAYEHHQTARVQTLLRTLNGRYEHRCCGLPR